MGTNGVSERELYELKKKAMIFYQENGVPEKMEEILNSMFYDQPKDVYGHLVNFFEKFSVTPTISKLKAREVLDSKGQPTLQTELYCIVRNNEELISCSVSSGENFEPEHALQEEKDAEDASRQRAVEQGVEFIQGQVATALVGLDPLQQQEADNRLMDVVQKLQAEEEERLAKERAENPDLDGQAESGSRPVSVASAKKGTKSPKPAALSRMSHVGPPRSRLSVMSQARGGKGKGGPAVVVIPDEPREKLLCGCSLVSAVSRAVCESGAHLARQSLFRHIALLKTGQKTLSYAMPLPMVTVLAGGRAFPGKNNCVKDYMVVPKPGMAMKEAVKMINSIYTWVAKSLTAKAGVSARFVSDSGALCPTMDKPEVGLDLLQEAAASLNLVPGEDLFFALNCGLHEAFDFEKGKYEVSAGQLKLGDDLVEFWAELLSRYPAIIALIDPMRKQDKEAWMKLCERVSDQCLIVGDHAYHRPGLLKNEQLNEDFKTSGIVLKMEQITSVSDLLQVSKKMEEAENAVIVGSSIGDSPDCFLADLAVGSGARFIKLGAPCRGEKVAKINRLIQIEADLEVSGQLAAQPALSFPHLEPPPPPPEEEGEEAPSPEKSESPSKKK